jgi:hypothetical protein
MSNPSSQEVASRACILKYQIVYSMAVPPQEYLQSLFSGWSRKEKKEFTRSFKERSNQLIDSLKSLKLWSQMTKEEKEFIRSIPPKVKHHQHLNAMWCLESLVVLMWALGLVDEFPQFDAQSDHEVLQKIPSHDLPEFIKNAVLKSDETILEMQSLAELWHWRSRTRQLIEMKSVPPQELGFSSFDEIVQKSAQFAFENGDIPEVINNDFPAKGKAYRDLSDDEWSEVRSISVERHRALNWLRGFAPGNRWDQTPTDT